jgi:hypothetical protein
MIQMPLLYRFFTADGLNTVKASKVDDELCLYLGKNPNDKDYSPEFLKMIEMAFKALDDNNEFSFKKFMDVCYKEDNTWMIGYYYRLLQVKYKLIIYQS